MVKIRAMYMMAMPIWWSAGIGSRPSGKIRKPRPRYWVVDFSLPSGLAATTMPLDEATPRRPVTTNSQIGRAHV